jgi:hypothetical protein
VTRSFHTQRSRMGRAIAALAVAGGLVTAAPAAHGGWHLTLDLAQGLLIPRGEAARYTTELLLAPEVELGGVVRLGVAGGAVFRNVGWDGAAGGRASLRAYRFAFDDVAIRLVADGIYLFDAGSGRVTGGALLDVLGLLRVGISAGRSLDQGRWMLLTSLGVDVISVFRLASGPKDHPLRQLPLGPPAVSPGVAELLSDGVRSRVLGILPRPRKEAALCWVQAHRDALAAVANVAVVIDLATRQGQPELARAVEESRAAVTGSLELAVEVLAVRRGLTQAVQQALADIGLTCGGG